MKTMKKQMMTLAAVLMAGAAVTSCSSDNEMDSLKAPAAKTYTMTVSATKGGDETRALNLDGNKLNTTWATTEHVYVKKGETWADGSLQPKEAGATATLTGTLSGVTIGASDEITLQFPKSGDITYAGQKGTLADIAANFDWATATATVASVEDGKITVADNVTFVNQQAVVKFTLKNGDNALSATKLVVAVGGTEYEVNPVSATSEIYVAIPGFSDQTVTLTATVGEDTYTYTTSSAKSFTNGKYYRVTAKMEKATDLSMVDNAGNARSTMSTANCYMVHTAGYYKLPLVYGNAIKNGADNTAAYTGVLGTNTTATFPNHADNAINAPWITKSTTGTGVNKGMGITVASAELLWQDAQGLITAVGISGDYLTLTVGKNATAQQGNAVVAVKDGSGNIVWSWHIWVTTETFASLTTVITGGHAYSVTPVNLGWVPTGSGGKQGYNTYYQWGRKDAFIPGTWNANTNHTVYNINNATVTGLNYESSTTATIADNIKNPTTHYNISSTNGPCNTKYYNMWDAQQTGTGNIATATKKTVYDPCPAGFCVPTGNLYCFMGNYNNRSMTTWDTNMGATWDNTVVENSIIGTALFFPASGCRNPGSGSLSSVGGYGFCWSASPGGGIYGRGLYIYLVSWYWYGDHRAYGFPVRAVAEE